MLALLQSHGFPSETIDFLRWYAEYITMPARDLLKRENRKRFPERRSDHQLSPNSVARRAVALRAYLGAAVNILGLAPESLTPGVLFGTGFDDIAHALVDWWHDRREARLQVGDDSAISGALGHYLVSIGMMCFTRYELMRFTRRLSVAVIDKESNTNPKDRTIRIDTMTEEGVAKTPAEQASWDAYRLAYAIKNKLESMVKDERGANRAGVPEFKNIKVMMGNTPPQWFITILSGCIEDVRSGIKKGRHDYKFHKLVRDTVDLAFHISTGCRSEESCLIRLDRHLTPERLRTRVIALQASERKNNKDHEVVLHRTYLPDDVLSFYLERSRPFFMRDQYLAAHPDEVRAHPFFLVSTRGNPYGVTDPGDPPQVLELAQRAHDHGCNLKKFLARRAVRCGLRLPGRKYELGAHPIRNVFAYAIYVMTGSAQAAAHYLGDEEQTVYSNYSAISGVHVDSSALVGFSLGAGATSARPLSHPQSSTAPRPGERTDGGPASAPQSDAGLEEAYLEKMEELRADRRAGIITQAQFDEAAAGYARKLRRVAAAGGGHLAAA